MTAVIAPWLSALLLPPLLLLLLASSTYEQVHVLCTLSGAAALARSRCAAIAKAVKNATSIVRPSLVGVVGSPLLW
jgi:hypothetical protein